LTQHGEKAARRGRKSGAGPKASPAEGRASPCPIVGIGASAGGIDALQKFFPAVPSDSGLAFVVVLHLDPEHKSTLADLLSRSSRLPVAPAREGMTVEPDHVYVIAPNATLTVEDGRLHLARPEEPRGHRNPVDAFFRSLAVSHGAHAACVILSGTGSDGTLGLRAIKENGGLTLAQEGAEYDGMMRSALATGLVDFVLPVEMLAPKLVEYFRHVAAANGKLSPEAIQREAADQLGQIWALLRARTAHDFSGYKDKTIIRRVQRRMQVLQADSVTEFLDRLRREPREVDLLFHDLLIGVTNFFRDSQAFEALEKTVIPRLFEGKGADDTIRVWIPGCATGEEAYSIAILLRERMASTQGTPKLKVFASDIDEHALEVARLGRYPASIVRDVSPKRLEHFFQREDGTYRIISDLRESCLFSLHNLLRDAPFSKLDLISCRNLLIYFNPELQNRVIPLFHYALRYNGYLFLGTSENVTRHPRLFGTVDKTHRIFQRRPVAERILPEFPLTTPDKERRKTPYAPAGLPPSGSLQAWAERQLLERYAPAYVVITPDGDVLFASGGTGKYLELPAGAPNHNIFSMARRGLRLDLRAAVHKATSSGQAATQHNVSVGINGGRQVVDLVVQPLQREGAQEQLLMVVFQDVGEPKPASEPHAATPPERVGSAGLRQLEAELRSTKERLQTTTEELESATEELESANEELKSSNEELSSMNEELQSANEELETSKEELQSINEELQTVNAELKSRVDELSRASSDIANLLESTQIATVFLDRQLAVKSFTPAAKDLFHLVESDTGRPIVHVRPRFSLDTIQDDAERVLRTLSTIERGVDSNDSDASYVMRMLPYRTADNVIGGVVMTFVDVTQITVAHARIDALTRELRNRVESLESLLDLLPVGIFFAEDSDGQGVLVNRYGARLLGEKGGGKGLRPAKPGFRLLENGRELAAEQHPLRRARTGEGVPDFEGQLVRTDGIALDILISAAPLFDESGKARGALAAVVDISQRNLAAAAQDLLVHELQHRVKNILATVGALAARLLQRSNSLDGFSDAFLTRLVAMGRVHDLLSQRNWQGADLRGLVRAALAPFADAKTKNISLDGPELLLKPGVAASLGMVLHELATNAAKYGALSTAQGHVDLAWQVQDRDPGRQLSFLWTEKGGPAVEASQKEGFGTVFLKRCVEYELEGKAELRFEREGLSCSISFPLRG
jgi:two-component system CheB/CheR fusion protein